MRLPSLDERGTHGCGSPRSDWNGRVFGRLSNPEAVRSGGSKFWHRLAIKTIFLK